MKHRFSPFSRPGRLPVFLKLILPVIIFCILAGVGMIPRIAASASSSSSSGIVRHQDVRPLSGDTCAAATVVNPATLPFFEDSTTVGAANNIDPGASSCAPGPGPDVVYSFTPTATDQYTVAATPLQNTFDLSLYIITDCANPSTTCVAGASARPFGRGETLTPTLTAGTHYFIVVDSVQSAQSGDFHFTVKRGVPANQTCETAINIAANRLPFSTTGTTYGAANNQNPGTPCLSSNQAANGPDVVYSFTSPDTQAYTLTVTPTANYDVTLYILTGCPTTTSCLSSAGSIGGHAESLIHTLTQGTTYYFVVDGAQGDAGDFTLTLVPSIPKAPAAPTNLVALAVSSTEIDLTWQDNSTNETGFRIERSLDGQNFTELTTVGANVTSFKDTGLTPETTYFYRVFAFNGFGNSDPTNVAADTTQKSPIPQFPVINVSPTSIEFGSVRGGNTATRTVTITNQGGQDLVISSISDPGGAFSILSKPATPLTIAPGSSINLTVQFLPPGIGRFTGSFTIISNDPNAAGVQVFLGGNGTSTPVPNLEVSQPTINFPSGSSVTILELRSTGDADLLLGDILPPAAPFSYSGAPPLPTLLKPGQSVFLTISFSPPAPGVYTSRITIVTNDPDTLSTVITLTGTSTPQDEAFKLRAPAQFTAIAGQSNTINVIAANGGNDIHLSATTVTGGIFTDLGNGRGSLVVTPAADAAGMVLRVTFTATDSQNRTKTFPTTILVANATDVVQVKVLWAPPTAAPNPPSSVAAINPFVTQAIGTPSGTPPSTLVGYAIYRSTSPGVTAQLSNLVGVATTNSFTDTLPKPAAGQEASFRYFYTVTALYKDGTESAQSNQGSTLPQIINATFRNKGIHISSINANIQAGAVLIVDGTEHYTLQTGDSEFLVPKSALSTPGNFKPKALIKPGTTHTIVVQNPNGQTSLTGTLTR